MVLTIVGGEVITKDKLVIISFAPRRKDGKAYGFFNCNAVESEIKIELPKIRKLVRTPLELTLELVRGMGNVRGDPRLVGIARDFEGHSREYFGNENILRYMLEATYPRASNRNTADELSGILNQAYQSPLFETGDPFVGAIVYEENGEFVFRD